MTQPNDGGPVGYHAIKALSNSSLSVLKRSPAEFYKRFVTGEMKGQETDAMLLGSAVHMLALEPERFDAEYRIESGPFNATTGKPFGRDTKKFEAWLDEEKNFDDRKILIKSEFENSLAIARAFQSHPVIAAIMASRAEKLFESEYSMEYESLTMGRGALVDLKCKIDFVCPSERLIIDLKTTSDPSPYAWSWSAEDFGYHRQAAIYSDAMQAKYGEPFRFLFGVVRSKEPYEAAVYELDAESINRGRSEYEALIEEYVYRKAKNDWLSEWQRSVFPINVPTRRRK
jgi:exodeoxyribonuclease VIII